MPRGKPGTGPFAGKFALQKKRAKAKAKNVARRKTATSAKVAKTKTAE